MFESGDNLIIWCAVDLEKALTVDVRSVSD